MVSEQIVSIKGHRYRYTYDRDTRTTQYLGPVGDSPPLSEAEFHRSIVIPAEPETFGVIGVRSVELGEVIGPRDERGWVEVKTHRGQIITLIAEDFKDKKRWKKVTSIKAGDILKFKGDPLGTFDVEVITKRDIKRGKPDLTDKEKRKLKQELKQELEQQIRTRKRTKEDEALDQLEKELADVLDVIEKFEEIE